MRRHTFLQSAAGLAATGLGARRALKKPPAEGGWKAFNTWHAGVDCVNPGAQPAYYTTGEHAWFAAQNLDAEQEAVRQINRASTDFVTFIPTGFFKGYQSWRNNLQGVVKAPFPVVWGVGKT